MSQSDERDRDEGGRARNARPRDALGRPLPPGEEGVPTWPEGLDLTPAESLATAQELLDAGRPFHAHEVLEGSWKSAPEAERQLWKGLAQLAVAATHAARGNPRGAGRLLERGSRNLRPHSGSAPHGIDVPGLLAWAEERREGLTGPGSQPFSPPRLRVR